VASFALALAGDRRRWVRLAGLGWSVHCRYGPRGSTRSTRWMAVSCARRALHELGHHPAPHGSAGVQELSGS
jgi:hypothetical protein